MNKHITIFKKAWVETLLEYNFIEVYYVKFKILLLILLLKELT